jgi:hypothetical protein
MICFVPGKWLFLHIFNRWDRIRQKVLQGSPPGRGKGWVKCQKTNPPLAPPEEGNLEIEVIIKLKPPLFFRGVSV